jgi:hypothetical protein
VLLQD